jgi:hypothetical protein
MSAANHQQQLVAQVTVRDWAAAATAHITPAKQQHLHELAALQQVFAQHSNSKQRAST